MKGVDFFPRCAILHIMENLKLKRRGLPDSVRQVPRPRKVPAWLEAERYFKRYRDTKKVIPLRMKLKGEEVG